MCFVNWKALFGNRSFPCELSVSIQNSRILEISDFTHKPSLLQFKNQTVMFG